jgi:hypothetical protein
MILGKWMEVGNIILSKVSKSQKVKGHMFSFICGGQTYEREKKEESIVL